ncbi:MAG: RNA polymerase sporulation sigma factor SigH [Clostridia bacterium]|nr:RNA polymerase sporulation sigma factor SigH [Clostridia bacterium]
MQNGFLLARDYSNMPDNDIVSLIQNGDNQALDYILSKYNSIVNIKASKFFAAGIERDDIVQEGMIGLYKATKSYDTEKQNSFKNFANLCIERQLITLIKSANRQKNMPLNSAFSLNTPIYENEDADVIEVLDLKTMEDPLDTITKKEYFKLVEKMMDESLSDFEKKVLKYYKLGKSYADIANAVDSKVKSVDTAIQRIRKKAFKIKTKLEGE